MPPGLDIETLLRPFPKVRPPLPEAYARIYTQYYQANRAGATPASALAQRVEGWLHHQVAADVVADPTPRPTLEIGAGTLNHLPYEPANPTYDIVEPFTALYADQPALARVRTVYADMAEVPQGRIYDRILSVATFEHLEALPAVVAASGLHLTPTGCLRVAIPSQGTLLWWLGWRGTTGLEFWLRHRLDYGVLMRHEHVNTAREIAAILHLFFRQVTRRVYGLSPALSLYQAYVCRDPDLARCQGYLAVA